MANPGREGVVSRQRGRTGGSTCPLPRELKPKTYGNTAITVLPPNSPNFPSFRVDTEWFWGLGSQVSEKPGPKKHGSRYTIQAKVWQVHVVACRYLLRTGRNTTLSCSLHRLSYSASHDPELDQRLAFFLRKRKIEAGNLQDPEPLF